MSWKSIKDELPKIGQKVILFSNDVVQEETFMFDMTDKNDLETEYFWSRDDLDECPELKQSDFWQPLPTAPSSSNSDYAKLCRKHDFKHCPFCGSSLGNNYICGCSNFA